MLNVFECVSERITTKFSEMSFFLRVFISFFLSCSNEHLSEALELFSSQLREGFKAVNIEEDKRLTKAFICLIKLPEKLFK